MKTITLHNFQSHADTTLELADTLTAITGESNKGKSSIIRAVKLLKDNVPAGAAFVRNGTKEMAVTIDGVSRIKNSKLNGYKIAGHPKPYKALHGAVPEQVTQSLDLSPESIQESQHKALFLLDLSSGKVARKLSELSDLESTTKALKHISSKKLKANAEIKAVQKSIEATEKQLQTLSAIPAINTRLAEIEREDIAIERLTKTYNNLFTHHENAVVALTELNALPSTKALEPAKQLIVDFNELQRLKSRRGFLSNLIFSIRNDEKLLKLDPTKLLNTAVRLQRRKKSMNALHSKLATIKHLEDQRAELEAKCSELEAKKVELFGDECPLCGSIL